jgi:lipid-A-disaccharide synthase
LKLIENGNVNSHSYPEQAQVPVASSGARALRILISAGEASGEAYGAQLIEALRRCANTEGLDAPTFFGLGGERMRSAGCETVVDANEVAVMGLAEVVSHLPRIYAAFRRLLRAVDANKPDTAVLVDFPDFNFRLAKQLHRRGVPVIYYVSPQLWAWRPGRIRLVRRYVRKMLVIFPFEQEFYREQQVDTSFVGHPLADVPVPTISQENFATQHGLDINKRWIALLPGSRRKEVLLNLPEMLRAAKLLSQRDAYEFIIPVAPTLDVEWLRGLHQASRERDVPIIFTRDPRATLWHARAAVVASGTATVEAALMGTPFVMVYRVSGLTYRLGKPLVRVPHYAMVNLIAGRRLVTELVQDDFTAENVVEYFERVIKDGTERDAMLRGLEEIRSKLHGALGAAERAAAAVIAEVRTGTRV